MVLPICTSGSFPPHHPDACHRSWLTFLRRLIGRLNPARRPRANPRLVKRKYLKWHVKRTHHDQWPQPTHAPAYKPIATN
jgi:hypothetical protein